MRVKKIHCMFHKDDTPSMALYQDSGYYKCFGCGAYGKLSDINLQEERTCDEPKYVEDIKESLTRITSLPKNSVRGLQFHQDHDGSYYIVWPSNNYYKKRLNAESKYRCPVGHKKPLFVPYKVQSKGLVIVEGEINAMTVASLEPEFTVVSPGPATDFMRKDYLPLYLKYDTIFLVVDKDAAGVCAGIELKAYLQKYAKKVVLYAMETDFNDILTQYGKEKVKEEYNKVVAMSRVWRHSGNMSTPRKTVTKGQANA